jgi:hypothetical protein
MAVQRELPAVRLLKLLDGAVWVHDRSRWCCFLHVTCPACPARRRIPSGARRASLLSSPRTVVESIQRIVANRRAVAGADVGRRGAMKLVGRRLPLAYTRKSLFSRPNIAAPQLLP